MHIDDIGFNIHYYLPARFGRFCDRHQGVTQDYKQNTYK